MYETKLLITQKKEQNDRLLRSESNTESLKIIRRSIFKYNVGNLPKRRRKGSIFGKKLIRVHKLVISWWQIFPRDCLNWVIENKIVLTYLIDACLKVFLISVIFQAANVICDIFYIPFDTTSVAGPSTKSVMESCIS